MFPLLARRLLLTPSTLLHLFFGLLLSPRTNHAQLEEPPTLSSLNAVLNHRSVLVGIKGAGTSPLARHRAIQRIEAMALDLGPDPECGDAQRARAKGPEKTAEGGGDEGTYTCKRRTKELGGDEQAYQMHSSHLRTIRLREAEGDPRAVCRRRSTRVRKGR